MPVVAGSPFGSQILLAPLSISPRELTLATLAQRATMPEADNERSIGSRTILALIRPRVAIAGGRTPRQGSVPRWRVNRPSC